MTEPGVRVARFLRTLAVAAWLFSGPAVAYLDLAKASVDRLDNGLTVIVLEDTTFPVVSVQMLYRSGARDEVTGKTGLAHFVEHMAFRESANFPDTELVSSIYAAGGEWHGYTWLDQTTYFATAPATELDLLLRIEADRVTRLEIRSENVEVESGAILSEMHGYENDPAIVLQDYVLYLSFLAHPYRNNTIGWESDIVNITQADLTGFYQRHYQPGNAVLAVVGDVRRADVMQRVQHHFAGLHSRQAPSTKYTVEPMQTGERRITLQGELSRKYFKIAYRAPPVSSPDLAAFLITQELLSAGSGINFLQNDWGTPARPGSALAGITEDITTWFPPSDQEYVFIISGSLPAEGSEADLEAAIEAGIAGLSNRFRMNEKTPGKALEQARERVRRELVFDVLTTEDAAHQLAFFSGLDALDVLVGLPQALQQVSVADIERILNRYLGKEQRTVGWYVPVTGVSRKLDRHDALSAEVVSERAGQPGLLPGNGGRAGPATVDRLSNGTPVILMRSGLSHTVALKVIAPPAAYRLPAGVSTTEPAWGLVSLDFELLPDELESAITLARSILDKAELAPAGQVVDAGDTESIFRQFRQNVLNLQNPAATGSGSPLMIVVSGDIEAGRVVHQLESGFGDLPARTWQVPRALEPALPIQRESRVPYPIAQERIGYIVRVAGPRPLATAAWQMALYILSHGYEGRLGQEAINRQGLVYSIESAFETDGANDWITLSMGVDPDKAPAMKALLQNELARLLSEPPSEAEIEEARTHLLGRYVSAAQSNVELADSLARQWIWYGTVVGYEARKQQLTAVRRQDIVDLLPEFVRGSIIMIRNPVEHD